MPEIRIPPVLRPDAGGNRTVEVEAATVRDALDALVERYPALKQRVLDGDAVPSFLNVFVDGEDVRLSEGLATSVEAGSTILLLPAVAGGAGFLVGSCA
jgi:molybdopterin converting factor small subunit